MHNPKVLNITRGISGKAYMHKQHLKSGFIEFTIVSIPQNWVCIRTVNWKVHVGHPCVGHDWPHAWGT